MDYGVSKICKVLCDIWKVVKNCLSLKPFLHYKENNLNV